MAVDFETRTVSMRSIDGSVRDLPMPAGMFAEALALRRVEVDAFAGRLTISLPGEPNAVVEVCRADDRVAELRVQRPIVYLDQNQWSILAAVRHGERPARKEDVEPARQLMQLSESERVLLPVSAGHLVETTPLYGSRRAALAGTVLALSRGWQMRNPLHARFEEVARGIAGVKPVADEMFAPGTDGLFSSPFVDATEQVSMSATRPHSLMRETIEAVKAVTALYEAVLDDEALRKDRGGAHASAEGWAAKFGDLARRMRENNEPASMVRRAAYANVQADMMDDILRASDEAGMPAQEAISRLNGDEDPIGRMPFLGQMRQVIYARLRNATQRWEANDLIDIMFLCCASGYADLVVGERQTIGYLRQARDPPPQARTATGLQEAVDLLGEA